MLTRQFLAVVLICIQVLLSGKIQDYTYTAQTDKPENDTVQYGSVFSIGEELTYEVSWHPIKLGTITLKMLRDESGQNPVRHKAVCYIDSYSGLPIVDLHSFFETVMDSNGYSYHSISRDKDGDEWNFFYYDFNYENKRVLIEESVASNESGRNAEITKRDTIAITGECLDGLSILYFARTNLNRRDKISVPTIVASKQNYTEFNFQRKHTAAEIDAVEYPVDVIELNGEAKYSGLFGLGGYFEGWFSNDAARIPIKAKMKVIIGSISIELKKWKRAGWNPPAFNKDR